MSIKVLDIGSWDDGTVMPWAGMSNVEVMSLPEETFLSYFKGKHPFREAAFPGCSSLYKPDASIIDAFTSISTNHNFKVVNEKMVETVTLDSLGYKPDLIKIDIQGAEWDAFYSGKETLDHAVAVQVEVNFLPLYEGTNSSAGEIFQLMESAGFFLHKFYETKKLAFRPFPDDWANQIIHVDAVFVKDWRSMNDIDLLRLTSIMFDIYKSYDFATYLAYQISEEYGKKMEEYIRCTMSTTP